MGVTHAPLRVPKATLTRFKAWLRERGSEILAPTNEYEALRFTCPGAVGIIWRSLRDPVASKMNEAAAEAWGAFEKGAPWRPLAATPRKALGKRKKALIARDGTACVYCEEDMGDCAEAIIEHVVPVTAQGPNHLANLALACPDCERLAGTLSAAEKIRFARRGGKRGTGAGGF